MKGFRYDRVTRIVYVTVGDEDFAFRLNISGLQQLESTEGKLFDLFQNDPTPSITTLVNALWAGIGGEKKIKREEAEKIAEKILGEYGVGGLTSVYFAMLALSGVFPAKVSKDLLESAGLIWKETIDETESQETGSSGKS